MKTNELRTIAFGRACHIVIENPGSSGSGRLAACQAELDRVERKFSSFQPDSIVTQINRAAGSGTFVPIDAETYSLFQFVNALWEKSMHLFDPTTHVLRDCYDEHGRLRTTSDQLQGMLSLVGLQHLELDARGAHLSRTGMQLDLNSVVRPYAVDAVRKLLRKSDITHAIVDLDHDTGTIGKQPDGSNWLIGVRLPHRHAAAIIRLKLNERAYSLRGDFEHTLSVNGERFSRVLSPIDGQPIPGLLCAAVIADSCLEACGAASIARLRTEASALKWLDSLGMPWLAVDRNLNCHGPLAAGF